MVMRQAVMAGDICLDAEHTARESTSLRVQPKADGQGFVPLNRTMHCIVHLQGSVAPVIPSDKATRKPTTGFGDYVPFPCVGKSHSQVHGCLTLCASCVAFSNSPAN